MRQAVLITISSLLSDSSDGLIMKSKFFQLVERFYFRVVICR